MLMGDRKGYQPTFNAQSGGTGCICTEGAPCRFFRFCGTIVNSDMMVRNKIDNSK